MESITSIKGIITRNTTMAIDTVIDVHITMDTELIITIHQEDIVDQAIKLQIKT